MAIQLSTATTTRETSTFDRAESTRVHGRLRLRFEARGERNQTILAESEQQLPLRIVRAFQLDNGGGAVHPPQASEGAAGGGQPAPSPLMCSPPAAQCTLPRAA